MKITNGVVEIHEGDFLVPSSVHMIQHRHVTNHLTDTYNIEKTTLVRYPLPVNGAVYAGICSCGQGFWRLELH